MLLAEAVKTETNCNIPSKAFSIKASPIAFDILSSKLYSDPILAIVRELLTNAYDSHKAAGTLDTPIHLNIPNRLEPNFVIRDYGTGLPKDDVLTLYTTFFDSTKATTNDFTGCFGLGSKTPFSYTSSFTVNSYLDGMKYSFIIMKKDGYPQIIPVGDAPTDENNGLEINIPVQSEDYYKFQIAINSYLCRMPEIIVDRDITRDAPEFVIDNVKCYSDASNSRVTFNASYPHNRNISIKQGQNIYSLDSIHKIKDLTTIPYVSIACCQYSVEIEVPIGTLQITPNREALAIDDASFKVIESILNKADNKLRGYFSTQWIDNNKAISDGLRALKNLDLTTKYFDLLNNESQNKRYTHLSVCFKSLSKTQSAAELGGGDVHVTELVSATRTEIKRSWIPEGKTLLILMPYNYTRHKTNKIFNTVRNYSLDSKYNNICALQMPKLMSDYAEDGNVRIYKTYYGEFPYIKFLRTLYSAIWTLNNIPEYNFDIQTISYTRFLREYPNHSGKGLRKKHSEEVTKLKEDGKVLRVKTCVIYSTNFDRPRGYNYNKSREMFLSVLKQNYYPKNTIIVENSKFANDDQLITQNHAALWYNLMTYMIGIPDASGNYPVKNFINNNVNPDSKFEMGDKFNVVLVNKVNKKFFKEYTYITIEKLVEYLKTKSFNIIYNTLDRTTVAFILDFNDLLAKTFPKRISEKIVKTNRYKMFNAVARILQKHSYIADMNICRYYPTGSILQEILVNVLGNENPHYVELTKYVPPFIHNIEKVICHHRRYISSHAYLGKQVCTRILQIFLYGKEK